jgi:hypothetical protein
VSGTIIDSATGSVVILIVIWIVVCLVPAVLEWKPVVASSSWAEASAMVSKVSSEPSKTVRFSPDDKSGLFDDTHISYQFSINDKVYSGTQDSMPHLAYFTHFPTDMDTEFKPPTKVMVRYQLDNPKQNVCPDICGRYLTAALAQGALFAVAGAVILLIWSVASSAMR